MYAVCWISRCMHAHRGDTNHVVYAQNRVYVHTLTLDELNLYIRFIKKNIFLIAKKDTSLELYWLGRGTWCGS